MNILNVLRLPKTEKEKKQAECKHDLRYIGGGRWICDKCGLIHDE